MLDFLKLRLYHVRHLEMPGQPTKTARVGTDTPNLKTGYLYINMGTYESSTCFEV